MTTAVRIRRSEDIPQCVQMLAHVYATDRYPLHWPADPQSWLSPRDLLVALVAESGLSLVGHVALCSATGESAAPVWSAASGLAPEQMARISRLFVVREVRGKGTGGALLWAACGEARSRGLHPALEVLDHDRVRLPSMSALGGSGSRALRQPGPERMARTPCCITT